MAFERRDTQSKTVVVTGSAGTLGGRVASALAARGHHVRRTDRTRAPDTVRADLTNAAGLEDLLRCSACVVHCAGLHGPHVGQVRDHVFLLNNELSTLNLLHAASRAKVQRFVFVSSTSVYGVGRSSRRNSIALDEQTPLNPQDINDLSKVICEDLVSEFCDCNSMEFALLRMGRFTYDTPRELELGKLRGAIDVRDAVAAVVRVVEIERLLFSTYCIASAPPKLGSNAFVDPFPLQRRTVRIDRATAALGFLPAWNFRWPVPIGEAGA